MDKISLAVGPRELTGKKNMALRAAGQTPAVVYGHGKEAKSIQVASSNLEKVYAQAGSNKIITLRFGEGKSQNALIQAVQQHPLTGSILHADFYLVKMDQKVKTEVPLHFVGESTAVYQQEGILVKNKETIEVEALPADLPEQVEVDISVLDDFDKSIHVSDLIISADVTLLDDPEELVVKVDPPRTDEELAELEEEVKAELPEGAEEEVAEEQLAEGEEVAAGEADEQPKEPNKE